MKKDIAIPMEIGHSIIRSYKRLGYKVWYALAEFIDNSMQSYLDNRKAIDAAGDTPPLVVEVDYDKDHLRVHDKAMGMDETELRRALSLGATPPNPMGRGEYGLGMKTAACWFGDLWTVTTKKLGEKYEYEVTVDVEKVAQGEVDLPTRRREQDPKLHYTTIDITKLHRQPHGQTRRRVEMYIRSMYRVDLRNADLWITINGGEALEPDVGLSFLKAKGIDYKRDFSTKINGKKVHGWIGILSPGGRAKAGFAIVRRGRVIKGQPEAWRPEQVFGPNAPNDLLNQRLVGEIHLDKFDISHTKDEILWVGNEEIDLDNYLADEFAEYISIAKLSYGEEPSGPDDAEIKLAAEELRKQMMSSAFVDALELQEIPPDDVVQHAGESLVESIQKEEPLIDLKVGDNSVQLFLNENASYNDPYFTAHYPRNEEVIVIVNTKHTHFNRITGGVAVRNFLMECVYDALAEWKATKAHVVKHNTIKYLKDGLLRLDVSEDETLG